jgi:hypothetical protein
VLLDIYASFCQQNEAALAEAADAAAASNHRVSEADEEPTTELPRSSLEGRLQLPQSASTDPHP